MGIACRRRETLKSTGIKNKSNCLLNINNSHQGLPLNSHISPVQALAGKLSIIGLIVRVFALILFVLPLQNCSKKVSSASFNSKFTEDGRLIQLLSDAKLKLNELRMMVGDESITAGDNLEAAINELERLIFQAKLPTAHNLVLLQIIYVEEGISRAGDMSLQNQIDSMIARIKVLEEQMAQLLIDFPAFRTKINSDLKALKEYTEVELAELHRINRALAADILAQKSVIDEMFASNDKIGTLQNKLCNPTPEGPEIKPCSGSALTQIMDKNSPDPTSCNCVSLDSLDCTQMFPGAASSGPRNQCMIMWTAIKNHDDQLKEIHKLNDLQNKSIAALNRQVENLNSQVSTVIKGLEVISDAIFAINARLIVVEFKAARAEGAAGLEERAQLTLAWIKNRTAGVISAFCHSKQGRALDLDDYESARHNHQFCHERLDLLNQAAQKVHIAEALISDGASKNVDVRCSVLINGTQADDLPLPELLKPNVFGQVREKCGSGQSLALGSLLNAARVLDQVAPDFRTVDHLKTKAPFAQLLSLGGKLVTALTASDITKRRALYDPTHRLSRSTYYGQIERLFKNQYVKLVHRKTSSVASQYLSGGEVDLRTVTGLLNQAYSRKTIVAAATPYLGRVKSLEIEGACGELCGWRVVKRESNASLRNPVVSRNGKKFYSFPKDPVPHCPIEKEFVVQAGTGANSGKNFIWFLTYDGIWEKHREFLSDGRHIQTGFDNNLQCTWEIHAIQPYGQRLTGSWAKCISFQAVCAKTSGSYGNTLSAATVNSLSPSSGFSANPLGPGYWVLQNAPANYGVNLTPISRAKPFYGPGAFGNTFLK